MFMMKYTNLNSTQICLKSWQSFEMICLDHTITVNCISFVFLMNSTKHFTQKNQFMDLVTWLIQKN